MPKPKPKSNGYWPFASHTTPTHSHTHTLTDSFKFCLFSKILITSLALSLSLLSSCRCDSWPLLTSTLLSSVLCSTCDWYFYGTPDLSTAPPSLNMQPDNSWLMPHKKVEMTHKKTLNANLHLQCHRCIFKLLSLKWTAGQLADKWTDKQVLQVRQRLKPLCQSRVSRVTQFRRACINIYSIFKTISGHAEFMLMHWQKI